MVYNKYFKNVAFFFNIWLALLLLLLLLLNSKPSYKGGRAGVF